MDYEMPALDRVAKIHEQLVTMTGSKMRVKANLGRSRILERTGVLISAHPSVFMLEVEERRGRIARQSYQYADILTGMVQLFEADATEPLFTFEEPTF